MLREAWACDFLFKMDAATDVSVLTSPAQLQYAVMTDLVDKVFEAAEEYHGMFNTKFECRWLVVPTLSVGHTNESFQAESPRDMHNTSAALRVIQDSRNGDLLLCVDEPADNMVA